MVAPLPWKMMLKGFVVTAITTYPFIASVWKLSDTDVDKYSPCNRNACILFKLVGQKHLPSTIRLWSNPFLMVRNGDEEVTISPSAHLSPRCRGKSVEKMQALCASRDTKKGIDNHLNTGPSKVLYICFVTGWFSCKVLHDCLLLCGVSEFFTLRVGLASLIFQLLAVAASFLWSMGAAEVYVAPLEENTCGCYYQLGEIETLLAIVTPVILYKMTIIKTEAVFRAMFCGDYLYFMQYHVPHHLVAQSCQDRSGSYLVASTHGKHLVECRQELDVGQLRHLSWMLDKVYRWLFRLIVPCCVGLALGPLVVRLVVLAIHLGHRQPVPSPTFPALIIAMLLLVALVPLATHSGFQKFFDFKACRVLPIFWEWSPWQRIRFSSLKVMCSAALMVAVPTMIAPLLNTLLGATVAVDASVACKWALAGFVIYGAGFVNLTNAWLRPAMLALAVKARDPWRPAEYLEADQHPEFELAEESGLAKAFLQEQNLSGNQDDFDKWDKKWHRALNWKQEGSATSGSLFQYSSVNGSAPASVEERGQPPIRDEP